LPPQILEVVQSIDKILRVIAFDAFLEF
jgi:hypothetical protein